MARPMPPTKKKNGGGKPMPPMPPSRKGGKGGGKCPHCESPLDASGYCKTCKRSY